MIVEFLSFIFQILMITIFFYRKAKLNKMATMAANTQRQAIGSEEYSLYSSLSEDELIKMAIQQSLGEDPVGLAAAQSHQKPLVAGPGEASPSRASSHNPPYRIYPWQR